ncbi:MAG: MarR family transcriptional regulator [Peptococcaceae bacterium]|nr:MAG: MarR family transcriptional regulator [Peptococcaceae bacterium]
MIDLKDNAGRHVSFTYRHMIAYMARRMEPLHIGPGQYVYLFALYGEDGQTQQNLSDRTLVDKSATARAINKLEALGYVERKPDHTDKRSCRVFLTQKGIAVKPQLEVIVGEVQDILLKDLSDEEKTTLRALLQKVSRNMIRATCAADKP